MKNKILKLCKRLNKITIDEILPILMLTAAETQPILDDLVAEGVLDKRNDCTYFYKEQQVKSRLPLFFECRTQQEVELIKRCFCADLPCTQTGIILDLKDDIILKFNKYYREYIYKVQYSKLLENFAQKPQEPRIRNFFDIPLYFYYYNGTTYVSEQKLYSKEYQKGFNLSEVREFKKIYLKVRRRIYHNEMVHYLSHHVAEAILRTSMSFDEMLSFIS